MCPHLQGLSLMAAAWEHPEHAAAGFCWKGPEPLWQCGTKLGHASVCPACKINLRLQSAEMGVYRLSYKAHIHECAFHVSITLQSPRFFPSCLLLSYGNPSLPPNIFSPMPGSWGWSRVFSEVWALSWRKQMSSGDLGSLRWPPECRELSMLIHIKVLGCLFHFICGSA